ncbi:acyl-CoA synthetase [Dictyobacter alpinus]|uniref:Acyl-CoA synthetase n=1 Tax=Dictyobacter alpinus TaxID=2014873 RepID=A0A402BD97_9CHLR|nr:fatty acyl-AMP ligase [Dictyobacter alpinus]GCE29296.1 acyl-CoA synthetase [Dictyobacter alpinus]
MVLNISYPASKMLTFVDILTQRAQQQPEQTAYTFLHFGEQANSELSYGDLDRQVRSIAGRLQQSGCEGKPILLLYPSGLEYITAFLACLYAGAIAVPMYPPSSERQIPRLQTIIHDTQAVTALTTTWTYTKIAQKFTHIPELQALQWIPTNTIYPSQYDDWIKPALDEQSLALLQYTSGSTSTPKGVMVSHSNLQHNSAMLQTQMGMSEHDRGTSWLPIFHDMGLILGVLQPLYTGYPTVLMSPTAFLQRPLRWLQTLSDYQTTVTYAPNFAYDLCLRRISAAERARLDLSHWQVAVNGAEPIRRTTLDNFSATFADCGFHANTFMPGYGLAEATLMVSARKRHTGISVKQLDKAWLEQGYVKTANAQTRPVNYAVSCGQGPRDQQVRIVNPTTQVQCQPDEIGEIWLSGPSVAHGYFHNQAATEHTFHAYLADTEEGPFLRTGDLGFLHDDELFITGRLKDLIIIAGRNHYPHDIEQTIEQSSPLIRAGCSNAFSIEVGEQECLVVVAEVRAIQTKYTSDEREQMIAQLSETIRRNIAEQHEIKAYQIELVQVGEIPKTSSGKLQRRACRTLFLAEKLKKWDE